MKHVLSYCYLDDLNHVSGSPWNFYFDVETEEEMGNEIRKIMDKIFRYAIKNSRACDDSDSDDSDSDDSDSDDGDICDDSDSDDGDGCYENCIKFPCHYLSGLKKNIINQLFLKGYWVWDMYEKNYVIGFAIDYKRFEVFSNGNEKKLVKWGQDGEDNDVNHMIWNFLPIHKMIHDQSLYEDSTQIAEKNTKLKMD
jgi:hypothetical protein